MKTYRIIIMVLCTIVWTTSVQATIITPTTVSLGGTRWESSFSILNDTLPVSIDEATLYFPYGLYANIAAVSAVPGWDQLVVQPDLVFGVPMAGFWDTLALGPGIPVGASATGFILDFDWLGAGRPGSLFFEIVDPASPGTVLDAGMTVPEPSALVLLITGACAFFVVSRFRGGEKGI